IDGGLWKFYTEDSTGLKIGPVPAPVMSLVFIASHLLKGKARDKIRWYEGETKKMGLVLGMVTSTLHRYRVIMHSIGHHASTNHQLLLQWIHRQS
ncbi:hypothetical protein PRIPAC_96623, partial [Pristionchus pacificus]|uniref:Uncharacterized protein n=1 Tax=Pristionchus pacificus TaxID=54126 RepID=A0A2A6BK10_PRIPA